MDSRASWPRTCRRSPTCWLALEHAADLTPAARADLKSAVRTVCRVLGMPPDAMPAHPGFLRPKLAAVAPAAHGIEVRRWANVKSLLHKALGIAGIRTMPGRYMAPHSPAWREKYQAITDRSTRLGLSRLTRFCSAQGIEPDEVNDAIASAYLKALEEESLVKDARRIWRDALTCWNRAVLEVPGWPQQTLSVPPLTQRYGLSPDCFPESFRLEVEAWLTRLAGGKFLEQLAFRPLRPATIRQPAGADPRTGLGPGRPGARPRHDHQPGRPRPPGGRDRGHALLP